MTTIEYLSLPLHKRLFHKFISFFASIPMFFAKIFTKKIPQFFVGIYKKIAQVFFNIYLFFVDGDFKTKLSFVFMGFGLFTRKSWLRGILYFLFQAAYIYFAVTIGINSLHNLVMLIQLSALKFILIKTIVLCYYLIRLFLLS